MPQLEQYFFGKPNDAIKDIICRCALDYELYLHITKIFKEQYDELKAYCTYSDHGFSKITLNDDRGQWLVRDEYFLWLYNNDHERLKELLQVYGDYLVERFLWSYEDVLRFMDQERHLLMPFTPRKETKELVLNIIGEKLERERQARNRERNSTQSQGIFNILTGDVVKPHDGTFNIDDFR